jgi:hypothetical protein
MYRAELTARRKNKNETLHTLEQDIRRLMALAYEDPQSKTSKDVAVDAFIRAMDDRDVADKVQELEPKELDDALRHALRFEAYAKNRTLENRDAAIQNRREEEFMGVAMSRQSELYRPAEEEMDYRKLLRDVEQVRLEQQRLSKSLFEASRGNQGPAGGNDQLDNRGGDNRGSVVRCYTCGETGHFSNHCPNRVRVGTIRLRKTSQLRRVEEKLREQRWDSNSEWGRDDRMRSAGGEVMTTVMGVNEGKETVRQSSRVFDM